MDPSSDIEDMSYGSCSSSLSLLGILLMRSNSSVPA